jgi:hypothetical protein
MFFIVSTSITAAANSVCNILAVTTAKVMAILRRSELLLSKNLMRRRIHMCCDSRAALAALAKTTTESSLVWECMQVLGRLSEFNKVTLVWIPRHQGIPAKEEADRLAKEGAMEVSPNQFTGIPFSVGKKTHQEAFGTETSGQVDCLYQLPTVQNVDEIPSAQ